MPESRGNSLGILARIRIASALLLMGSRAHNTPARSPAGPRSINCVGARRFAIDRSCRLWDTGRTDVSFTIRALHRTRDRRGVEAIDTGFETDVVFDLVTGARDLALVERRLEQPITKRYSIGEVFAPWARWDRGWVAEAPADPDADAGGPVIRGFATTEYEAWHGRLVLWFLYIAPDWRRRGVGRALLAEVEAHGCSVGATHVWLETSNVNVPGVAAYERLGYSLCGADRLYYGDYMPGETALYLAKSLGQP